MYMVLYQALPSQGLRVHGRRLPAKIRTWLQEDFVFKEIYADRHRDPLATYATYQSLLDANWQQSQQTLEAYNDNMFSNSSWAAMLMYVITKGLDLVD